MSQKMLRAKQPSELTRLDYTYRSDEQYPMIFF